MLDYEIKNSIESPFYTIYEIQKGDTLYNVSKIFDVNQNELVSQNKTIYLLPEQMIFYKRD